MILLSDLLRISIRQVLRQRKQTLGVVLAIALGTAGLIAIVSMGDEVKKNLNRDLDLLGGATLIKISFDNTNDTVRHNEFSPEAINALRKIPGVATLGVSSNRVLWTTIRVSGKDINIPIQGVDQGYWTATGLEVQEGRLLLASDIAQRKLFCVLGRDLAQNIYGDAPAVEHSLQVGQDIYEVVGVVGGLQIADRKDVFFVPITTYVDRASKPILVDRIYLRCKTWDDVPIVSDLIPDVMQRFNKLDTFNIEVAWEHLERVKRIIWWVELFIYLSICATLTLGGFGIWNGMMSAVAARTGEIGLKKAMGAEEVDILTQFLTEATCLSMGATVVGILLGWGTVAVTSHYLGSSPPQHLLILYTMLSILFSCVLGLAAGFYPALRASRMDVVSAIRYE